MTSHCVYTTLFNPHKIFKTILTVSPTHYVGLTVNIVLNIFLKMKWDELY